MTEFPIREIESADLPALTALWTRAFGDSEALIAAFFRLLPDMGVGVTALADGEPVGAAYLITGLELADAGDRAPVCGYLYAVAVAEERRHLGLGRALSRAAAELAEKRGAELLCTLPAEPSLYGWYEEILGLRCALRRKNRRVAGVPGEPCMKLSATEYLFWRENLLRGRPHVRLGVTALEFQRLLCEAYGGGFYACGGGVAAAYREDGRLLIRELLTPEGKREAAAAALGGALGAEEVLLFEPAGPGEGEPYIAARPSALPPDCIWNLSFD